MWHTEVLYWLVCRWFGHYEPLTIGQPIFVPWDLPAIGPWWMKTKTKHPLICPRCKRVVGEVSTVINKARPIE